MRGDEAYEFVVSRIQVNDQMVAVAKTFIVKNIWTDTESIVSAFLSGMGGSFPSRVILAGEPETIPALKRIGAAFSWKLAAYEAIWRLVHGGVLVPASTLETIPPISIHYVENPSDSQRNFPAGEGEWRFVLSSMMIPGRVALSPSLGSRDRRMLADPDLFLDGVDSGAIPAAARAYLAEAVHCYQAELYLACLTVLGRSAKKAWGDLAATLADFLSGKKGKQAPRHTDELSSRYSSVSNKMNRILELFRGDDIPGSLLGNCGMELQDLRSAANWTEVVWSASGAVATGKDQNVSILQEKAMAALLGAVRHIETLGKIRSAALSASLAS